MVNQKDRKKAIDLIKKETHDHFTFQREHPDSKYQITMSQTYCQALCDMAIALGIDIGQAGMNPFTHIHLVGDKEDKRNGE